MDRDRNRAARAHHKGEDVPWMKIQDAKRRAKDKYAADEEPTTIYVRLLTKFAPEHAEDKMKKWNYVPKASIKKKLKAAKKKMAKKSRDSKDLPKGHGLDAEGLKDACDYYLYEMSKAKKEQRMIEYVETFKTNYPIKEAKGLAKIARREEEEEREARKQAPDPAFFQVLGPLPKKKSGQRGKDLGKRQSRTCLNCVENGRRDLASSCKGRGMRRLCQLLPQPAKGVSPLAGVEDNQEGPAKKVARLG